jgi:hypothetical protein
VLLYATTILDALAGESAECLSTDVAAADRKALFPRYVWRETGRRDRRQLNLGGTTVFASRPFVSHGSRQDISMRLPLLAMVSILGWSSPAWSPHVALTADGLITEALVQVQEDDRMLSHTPGII